jgi:hypothetical protein
MPSPIFLVEGQTEKLFIEQICPGTKILRLEINGRNVAVGAVVERAASLIRLQQGRTSPSIILFDREDRLEPASAIAQEVSTELSRVLPAEHVVVGVADRMIENCILADWEALRSLLPNLPQLPPITEGLNGKAILKNLLRTYSKTVDGPKLLRSARPGLIRLQSQSFAAFRVQLSLPCPWLYR